MTRLIKPQQESSLTWGRIGLTLTAACFCFSQYFLHQRAYHINQYHHKNADSAVVIANRQLGEGIKKNATTIEALQEAQVKQAAELQGLKELFQTKLETLDQKVQELTNAVGHSSSDMGDGNHKNNQQVATADHTIRSTDRQHRSPRERYPHRPARTVETPGGSPCMGIYFWGGGKAGSTTLATLLKHEKEGIEWDAQGEFLDLPKEICWAYSGNFATWQRLTENKCNPQFKYAVDGCPRLYSAKHASNLKTHDPKGKMLMLIRDPIDRMVSHLNDHIRRGGRKIQVDQEVSKIISKRGKGMEMNLSMYGTNLQNLLQQFPPEQVLVINTQALKTHPQEVMDNIMEFLGGQRKHVTVIDANDGSSMRGYQQISNETRALLKKELANDVALLEQTMGRKFSWNDWVPSPDGIELDSDTTWLTATPNPVVRHISTGTTSPQLQSAPPPPASNSIKDLKDARFATLLHAQASGRGEPPVDFATAHSIPRTNGSTQRYLEHSTHNAQRFGNHRNDHRLPH